MASVNPAHAVYLDPADAARARAERRRRFHTWEVPRLRFIGLVLCAIGVILHNRLVFGEFSVANAAVVSGVLLGYALASWIILAWAWDRVRVVDLGDAFFVVDLMPMMFVVYVTGATESFMWFVFIARVADQVAISFRHALVFSHLATAAYAAIVLWVGFGEGRVVDWPQEIAKISFLYFLSLYITLSARAVAARRHKFDVARRMAEQAVRDATDRRKDLEHALSRLEAANRTKTEFLANVSHEIRTPLNSVVGNADLLLDTPLSRDQQDLVGVIRDSAESLTRIVSDILDLSRMDAQRLPLESIPLHVRELAGTTVRMFAARAHQKGLALVCHIDRDVPDGLRGDPHRLRQILTNIINNAIKFTDTGDVIVRIALEDERDGRTALRFSVRDTGIGIPTSRQVAIFEAFTQADGSDTRRFGGTGLGLTIAAQLVSLMDGRLWVESEAGHGSTFCFVAWFGHEPARDLDTPWQSATLRVLVAHGHAPTRAAAVELLAGWSISVADAASGRTALAAMEVARDANRPFNMVLLDPALPALDGFALAERVKAEPALARHTVLLLSTTQLATGGARAVAMGAAYVTTPLVAPVLSGLLASAATGQALPGPAPAGPRRTRRPLRALVVDDHVVNQAVASAILRKWGHAVSSATDGQEAVEKTGRDSFDVVLMDLQMPVMDGLEATRQIRAREESTGARRLPILAMTARVMLEDREQCAAAGMDGFLSKPIDAQQVFDLLESIGVAAPPEEAASLTPHIGDAETSRHVASLYVTTTPAQLDRLRLAIRNSDLPAIASLAHSMRGATSHFAGASVSALEQLEARAKAGTLDNAPQLLEDVDTQTHTLLDRLRQFLA
jgi:signal transduction histidine kinase/DNA-binding response OmpR family regulator